MAKINYNKHIWEGWTVQSFVDDLTPMIKTVMEGGSWMPKCKSREEMKTLCMNHQPYYKKYIKEVVDHFSNLYNLK